MKHVFSVTLLLVFMFLFSQVFGLFLVAKSVSGISCLVSSCSVDFSETVVGERPEVSGSGALFYVIFGLIFGTVLLLLLARFNKVSLWRLWFFLASWLSMSVALGVFLPALWSWLISLFLAWFKFNYPNIIIYNVSEVLMYSGIAVIFVPLIAPAGVFAAVLLLLIISAYDAFAVWRSKHMIKMAKFLSGSNSFAGLTIPYSKKGVGFSFKPVVNKPSGKGSRSAGSRNAILGGGDITFPLFFSGSVFYSKLISLSSLGVTDAFSKAFFYGLLPSLGATLALALLFFFAKKDEFYPAMSFLSAGCFLGLAVSLLF